MSSGHPHLFEEFLEEYEASWQRGTPLEIRPLLERWGRDGDSEKADSSDLLAELIMIAMEYAWRQYEVARGGIPHLGRLLDFDPDLRQTLADSGLTAEVLIEEFRTRQRWGDRPSLADFQQTYPEDTTSIREQLESLEQEFSLENSIRNLFAESSDSKTLEVDASQIEMSIPDFLSGVYPFSELPTELIEELAAAAVQRSFQPGDYLMHQGDESSSLMVVMEGVAKVTIQPDKDDNAEQELARVGVYSLLGEIGLLTGEVRSANLVAMTPMTVAEIRYESYHALVARFPTLNMLVSELIAQRVGTIATDIMFGKSLGGYVFRHRLGRGSMGIVYLAEDKQTSKSVAVKMLRHDLVYDRQASQRFRREAQVIRRLKHENIIEVYREFSAYNTFFLSMEYCRGCTLGDAIEAHAPFSLEDTRKIVGQLASALLHAHSQGVIHRDLKPANVMLTAEGILKLTDFGLARSVESLKMTAHGQMLGTPRYMPSELLGGGEADERADLYALGAITWELLTGTPLFTSTDIVSLLREQLAWQLPAADDIRPDLTEDLYQVLAGSLSQTPDERSLELESLVDWAAPIAPSYSESAASTEEPEESNMDSTIDISDDSWKKS
ncbi:MAG: protein kinase [Planctomycetaceae bacterium]|nr:protein kinase [Planctomycetaceae bacterium]